MHVHRTHTRISAPANLMQVFCDFTLLTHKQAHLRTLIQTHANAHIL